MASSNDWRDTANGMTVAERAAAFVTWAGSEAGNSEWPEGTFGPLIAFGHACAAAEKLRAAAHLAKVQEARRG
jgi:hypothetical protein